MRIIADIITPPCSLIGVWSDVMRATSQTNQLWPRRVVCSPAVQMNFTVTDRTQMTAVYSNSHHWNIMQTAPGRFKYVVSGESLLQRFNTCVFYQDVSSLGSVCRIQDRPSSCTSWRCCVSLRLKIAMQILLSGPVSADHGPQLSTYSPFMDICFTSCATGQKSLPSSAG